MLRFYKQIKIEGRMRIGAASNISFPVKAITALNWWQNVGSITQALSTAGEAVLAGVQFLGCVPVRRPRWTSFRL